MIRRIFPDKYRTFASNIERKAMLTEKTLEKLRILAESAKYDVSC